MLIDEPLYYRIKKFEEFSQEFVFVETLPHKYLTKEQAEMKIKALDKCYLYVVQGIYWFDLVAIED